MGHFLKAGDKTPDTAGWAVRVSFRWMLFFQIDQLAQVRVVVVIGEGLGSAEDVVLVIRLTKKRAKFAQTFNAHRVLKVCRVESVYMSIMDPFALGLIVGVVLSALLVSVVLVPMLILRNMQRDNTCLMVLKPEMAAQPVHAPKNDVPAQEEPAPEPVPPAEPVLQCTACYRPHDKNSLIVVDTGSSKTRRYTCPHCGHIDSLPE